MGHPTEEISLEQCVEYIGSCTEKILDCPPGAYSMEALKPYRHAVNRLAGFLAERKSEPITNSELELLCDAAVADPGCPGRAFGKLLPQLKKEISKGYLAEDTEMRWKNTFTHFLEFAYLQRRAFVRTAGVLGYFNKAMRGCALMLNQWGVDYAVKRKITEYRERLKDISDPFTQLKIDASI